jgi:hypothetical protein
MGSNCTKVGRYNTDSMASQVVQYKNNGEIYIKRRAGWPLNNPQYDCHWTYSHTHKFNYSTKEFMRQQYIIYYNVTFLKDVRVTDDALIISRKHTYCVLIINTSSNNAVILDKDNLAIYSIENGMNSGMTSNICIDPSADKLNELNMNNAIEYLKNRIHYQYSQPIVILESSYVTPLLIDTDKSK